VLLLAALLADLVPAPLVAARLVVLVEVVLVDAVFVAAVADLVLLVGLALAELAFAAVVFRVVEFLLAAFPVVADLPLADLADFLDVDVVDAFRAEFVEVCAVVPRELVFAAVDLLVAGFVALADTVARVPLAASTLLLLAESAADTATQTPPSLRLRRSFFAWEAGMAAFSHTSRTSSALT
jgi:hypothetical protein